MTHSAAPSAAMFTTTEPSTITPQGRNEMTANAIAANGV